VQEGSKLNGPSIHQLLNMASTGDTAALGPSRDPGPSSRPLRSSAKRHECSHVQGLISGLPHPDAEFQGIVNMWSVNVWPKTSLEEAGRFLGDWVSVILTRLDCVSVLQ
jgi:hypothetical protein